MLEAKGYAQSRFNPKNRYDRIRPHDLETYDELARVRDLASRCLTCPVPGRDVCKFMSEDTRDLRLIIGL